MIRKMAVLKLCLSSLLCCCALSTLSSGQVVANKQQIMRQARQSYYNLRNEGLSSFACTITPNWELLLQDESKNNPEGAAAAIEVLSQLHFTVDLGADNSVKLTHNELTGQSEQMKAALKQIYGGMEQMTAGFFDTWKRFMLTAPFPEVSGEYQLEARGPQYVLTHREDTNDIVTTMGRDFAIANRKETAAESSGSLEPSFTKTAKGFLLSGYQASYQSQKPEEATKLKVRMDYQPVDGLQMIRKLNLSGTYGGTPFAVELTFSDCQVRKK